MDFGLHLSPNIAFALAVVVLMLKPGPFMMTSMSFALEGKWKSIAAFWLGYGILRTFMYFFLLTTLTALPQGFGLLFIFLKGFAAIMLLTMGVKGLQGSMDAEKQSAKELKEKLGPKNFFQNVLLGGLIQVSNPYDYVFVLIIIPSLYATTQFSIPHIALITIIVWVIDIIVNLAYILPILHFQKKFSQTVLIKIKRLTSIFLILIGVYIFGTIFFDGSLEDTNLISPDAFSEMKLKIDNHGV